MKKIIDRLIITFLRNRLICNKIISTLKQYYFHRLDITIPLSNHLQCPIDRFESYCCYNEIFISEEYKEILEMIETPRKWLDIGCHQGFFSLYVEQSRRLESKSGSSALLVDADTRVIRGVEKLISINSLDESFYFQHGLIQGGQETGVFFEDDFMSSSLIPSDRSWKVKKEVPVLNQSKIMQLLEPPYDLIKLDIEGGEYDFLSCYKELCRQAKYIVMEWHSWHCGGGGLPQLKELLSKVSFEVIYESKVQQSVGNDGQIGLLLAINSKYPHSE